MPELAKFIQIALPCLTFSPHIALGNDTPETVKKELNRLTKAARGGEEGEDILKLAKKYFSYSVFLQERSGMDFGSDAFSYFFLSHEQSPSENISCLPKLKHKCKVKVVRLIDKSGLVKDVRTGKKFVAQKKFRPGKNILDNIDKINQLVILYPKPKIYIIDNELRKRVIEQLSKIDFEIGPLVELNGELYLTHWDTLCYKLEDDDITRLKRMGVLT